MTTNKFISRLKALGIQLRVEGDRLRASAPPGVLTPQLREELRDRKPEVIAAIRAHFSEDMPSAIDRLGHDGPVPLSFAQERMWFVQQLTPESTAYNVCTATWLEGDLDQVAMQDAWRALAERQESLRTVIVVTHGVPFQTLPERGPLPVEWSDLTDWPESERDSEAQRLVKLDAARPFDLATDWLARVRFVRMAEKRWLLTVVIHHVIGDLWALGVISREIVADYNARVAGRESGIAPPAIQYRDFSAWHRQWLAGDRLANQVDYWRRQLRGLQPLSLPTDHPRGAWAAATGALETMRLPDPLIDAIQSVARRNGCTPFMVALAAFNVLLFRYSRMTDIGVGVPIANRTHVETESVVGTFVNTLVLRNDLSGDPTFSELLARVREVALDAYEHQDLPFEKLVTELNPDRDATHGPLVQVLFNVTNVPARSGALTGLTATPAVVDNGGAQFDLTVTAILDHPGAVSVNYSPELHEAATARRLCSHYRSILEELCRDEGMPLSEVKMISDEEEAQVVRKWNETAMEYPRNSTFIEHFERTVERVPDVIALQVGDECITYSALNSRAERVARALVEHGAGVGSRVAIMLARGPDLLASLLGVMKCGAAYVPLDPAYPPGRLRFVLEDAGAVVALTEGDPGSVLDSVAVRVLDVTDLGSYAGPMETPAGRPVAGPLDPAYIIYTSGSTGQPKGVAVPNRALVNFLFSMAERPGVTGDDVLAAVTTISFDIAGLELYLPLLVGGCVALMTQHEAEDPYRLMERLTEVGATVLQATPATWRMLLEAGWTGRKRMKALCGGEALPRDLAEGLLPLVGELWNMYGPTETTIWSTVERIRPGDRVLVGRPIGNTSVYILDEYDRPVPVGVPGEICIGGDGVALGYVDRDALTREKFVPDPFQDDRGGRMYRTGDLGRFKPDGRIEHLGRLDHQVKVRGFRIELGEIESILVGHGAVDEAVVLVHNERLVAYLVFVPGQQLTVTEIRSYLRDDLPAYMIPAIVVPIEKVPLTPAGKVDRRALPDPFQQGRVAEREYVEPETELGRMVAEVWTELLPVERVGAHDNFFDLGGHSLLAMQVVARVEERTGTRLDPRAMFFQTLEQMVSVAERVPVVGA